MKPWNLLLACLLAIHFVTGLSISPASLTVSPDSPEFRFTTDRDVSVRVEGDLAAYVTIDPVSDGVITGRIDLPDLPPGEYAQRVVARQAVRDTGGTVSSTAEVAGQLVIRVPRPDAFLRPAWDVSLDGRNVRFTVMLENLGLQDVLPDAVLVLLGNETVPLEPVPVPPEDTVKITGRHVTALDPGVHDALLRVTYGNRTLEDTRQVTVGTPGITLERVDYLIEERGPIRPLDVAGNVEWNRPLPVEIAVKAGNETLHREELTSQGGFETRLYLEGVVSDRLLVEARTGSAVARATWERRERQDVPWTLMIAALLVLVGVALLVKRKSYKGRG